MHKIGNLIKNVVTKYSPHFKSHNGVNIWLIFYITLEISPPFSNISNGAGNEVDNDKDWITIFMFEIPVL